MSPEHEANSMRVTTREGREAYRVLIEGCTDFGLTHSLGSGHAQAVRFHDFEGRYLFSFIPNRLDLLFYFRHPALRLYPGLAEQIINTFPTSSVNPAGEVKIRLSNSADAEMLLAWLQQSKASKAFVSIWRPPHHHEDYNRDEKGGNMAIPIEIPASRVRQGSLTLYATSISVSELVKDGFYSVETLDPDDLNDKGYQRLLNKARAKRLADYILKGQDSQDAFLPTSVFLATDKKLPFDMHSNKLSIDSSSIGPFSVVDGQHRLEGLKMAAEKDPRVLEFEIPVNIAAELPRIAQMCHFLIVNTTQKSVDKAVEQRIVARLTEALDVEDLPSLPKWILNTVERGEVDRAVKYIDYLNDTDGSPWLGRIAMANDSASGKYINQRSFVTAIVKYVLTANNPIAVIKDLDKEKKVFLNYWKAICNILDDGNSSVLYKYNGVELFCKFSIPFFIKMQDTGNFTVQRMEEALQNCFDNVDGDYAGVGHPEWWASGGKGSFLNAGAINVVSQELSRALHKGAMNSSIQL